MDRYKVVSGLMALAAVFLVIVGFRFISNNADFNFKNPTANLSFENDDDWDNDGLTNREESYWNTDPNNRDTDGDSYLDGEEVISGHDPLIPAPNDLIDDDNLTNKLSGLILAGLYEGSLKRGNQESDESVNNLALTILDDAFKKLGGDASDVKLKIVSADKTSQELYIQEFSKIFEDFIKTYLDQINNMDKNLSTLGNIGFSDKTVGNSFQTSAEKYKHILMKLTEIRVPQNWKLNHLGFIKFVGNLTQASQSVITGENDPIKAAVALNQIVSLWDIMPDIIGAYSDKVKNERLNTDGSIF